MRQRSRSLALLASLLCCVSGAAANQDSSPAATADELIAREQLRRTVEDALELYQRYVEDGAVKNGNFLRAVDRVVAAGSGAVPFLVIELEQALPKSFFFCAYALGRLGTPEAEAALRRALEKTESEPGNYAQARKGWAAYGLALTGAADAVTLVYEGKHKAGHLPMQQGLTMVEAIALQVGSPSVPLLVEMVDRSAAEEDLRGERIFILRALWRVPDAAAVPKLIAVAAEDDFRMRREAVRALAFNRGADALPAAWAGLDDDEVTVRHVAAEALERAEAEVSLDLLKKKLKTESSAGVRGAYIRMLAERGGASMIPFLATQWEQAEAIDRMALIRAVGSTESADALPLLRKALADPDGRVATRAVATLSAIHGAEAIELLGLCLHASNWNVVHTAAERATELKLADAGAAIAERLLKVELNGVMNNAAHRYRVESLVRLLVRLGYVETLPGLREATARQEDPVLIRTLEAAIDSLELQKKIGRDRDGWIATLNSPQRDLRSLAYVRLGELGDETSARSLARAFGRVPPDEGAEILRALGETVAEPAQALVERILNAPEFDAAERAALRDEAAWSARRIGGDRMREALARSAERTEGASTLVLVYLAVLDAERALPLLQRCRVPRMRSPAWSRGKEMQTLDWIARRIETGRSLLQFDEPPGELTFK